MTKASLAQYGLDRAESGDNSLVPFTVEGLDCRGRSVVLGDAIDTILSRHDYPTPVARLLGEAIVLTALVGSSLKFEGKFILQTQTDGPISMIVVDLEAPDGLRGYARFDRAEVNKAIAEGKTSHADLLGKGHLAMTVDQGEHMERYQGIVALDGTNFEEVADQYFLQSEQIPTVVRIAVAEHTERGDTRAKWRAAGVLVQYLPLEGENNIPDLPGDGDFSNPESNDPNFVENNNWTEAKSLTMTVSDFELVDPEVSPERLLFRLFHEQGVRVFDTQPMEERCSCSAERIEDMLLSSFSQKDREEMAVDGEIEVVCEFCSSAYHFTPAHFETAH